MIMDNPIYPRLRLFIRFMSFQKFAKLQKTKPKRYDDMEYIAQPQDDKSGCDCKRRKKKKKVQCY